MHLVPLLGISQEHQAKSPNIHSKNPLKTHVGPMHADLASVSPCESCLVDHDLLVSLILLTSRVFLFLLPGVSLCLLTAHHLLGVGLNGEVAFARKGFKEWP